MNQKIIVVDGDGDFLTVIQTILTIFKYQCFTFNNWQMVYQKVKEIQPDLILMDVNLKGMDRNQLSNQLKIGNNTGLIPIILISDMDLNESLYKDFNAVDFIKKPFDVREFHSKIETHLTM